MDPNYFKLPRGTVVEFESGEYSDRHQCGLLVTTKDIDLREQGEAYKAAFMPEEDWQRPDPDGFPSYLVAQGLAMPVESRSFHLGSYSEFQVD